MSLLWQLGLWECAWIFAFMKPLCHTSLFPFAEKSLWIFRLVKFCVYSSMPHLTFSAVQKMYLQLLNIIDGLPDIIPHLSLTNSFDWNSYYPACTQVMFVQKWFRFPCKVFKYLFLFTLSLCSVSITSHVFKVALYLNHFIRVEYIWKSSKHTIRGIAVKFNYQRDKLEQRNVKFGDECRIDTEAKQQWQ